MGRRFVKLGEVLFTPDVWHRVAFQPLLYLFLWAATIRVAFSDGQTIPFEAIGGHWIYHGWLTVNLTAPPMTVAAWWLIKHSRAWWASLAGIWLRLAADTMMFGGLLGFHLARMQIPCTSDATIYSRYLTAAALAFIAVLIVRDVWVIVAAEKVTRRIWDTRVRD